MQPIPGQSVAQDAASILQSQQNPALPEEGASDNVKSTRSHSIHGHLFENYVASNLISESAFNFRAGSRGAEPLLQL
jgi:hypothetical protein